MVRHLCLRALSLLFSLFSHEYFFADRRKPQKTLLSPSSSLTTLSVFFSSTEAPLKPSSSLTTLSVLFLLLFDGSPSKPIFFTAMTENAFTPKRKRASEEDQRQHEDHDDTTSEQEKSKWLQITCYPSHFFTKFEEIRPSLSNNVLNILYSSPFGHFFLRNKDISMEKSLVQDIVSTYSTSRSVFVVGDLEINLGSEEACLLLGLPLVGNSVNLAKRGTASGLRRRYSMLHGRVTRQRLFSCIKEAISHRDDENAARLLIMFLFATILFPASNSSVPTALFEYVDDLYSLWSFKWGDEVLKYLLGSVRHVVGSRKAGKSMGQLHGCSLLLLAMLYYRSENPRVFCGRGLIPRLLNLDFKRTWKSLEKLSPFKEITIKAQTYEKWIFSGSSRPTEWMDMLLSTMSRKQRKEMNVNFSKSSSVRHELEVEVPVEEVHMSNELENNHTQLELRIAAYEVELMELKKHEDLNQRTFVEKINNLEKDTQLALVDFEQQQNDEMVEIQRNQLALVDKLNAFEQQHKDEMVEVQRYQLALVSKFDTFEKDNASLRSNVDLLFKKVMQKLEKLDKIEKMEEFIKEKFETKEDKEKKVNQDEVEECCMTSGSPSSTIYSRRQKNPRKTIPTLKVLNKLRQVYSETEDKCNKTDEQTPFLEQKMLPPLGTGVLTPKTVMITGASRGLALDLATKGHTVIGCARTQEKFVGPKGRDTTAQPAEPPLLTDLDVRSDGSVKELA